MTASASAVVPRAFSESRRGASCHIAQPPRWTRSLHGSLVITHAYGRHTFAIPVVGDWDGDGKDGIGYFTKSSLTWTIRQTATAGPATATFQFGRKGADPVVGDWNGDGKDGIGIFVRDTATWSLRQTASAGVADVGTFKFGKEDAIPIVGNFVRPVAGEDALITSPCRYWT